MFPLSQDFSHGIKDNNSIKRLGRGYKPRPAWMYAGMSPLSQDFSHGIKDNNSIKRLGRGYKPRPAWSVT